MSAQFAFDDRPNAEFFSGDTIKGRVMLQLPNEKNIKGAYISFCGMAKSSFVRPTYAGSTYYVPYNDEQELIHAKSKIRDEGILDVGTHIYTFSILIPIACATSCRMPKGVISYELMLMLEMLQGKDEIFTKEITVIQQVNLNFDNDYLIPLQQEDMKYLCCFPCRSGPIRSELRLPLSGFVPGQEIPCQLLLENNSYSDLKGYEIKLIQRVVFQEVETDEKILVSVKSEQVIRSNGTGTYTENLRIPPVAPTTLPAAKNVIKFGYMVQVIVDTGDWHCRVVLEAAITIGSIPLLANASNVMPSYEMRSGTEAYDIRYPVYFNYPLPQGFGNKF